MKIARFAKRGLPYEGVGIVIGDKIIDMVKIYYNDLTASGVSSHTALDLTQEFTEKSSNFVKIWLELKELTKKIVSDPEKYGEYTYKINEVKLLPPITTPSKIIGVALNYIDHAKETGREPPKKPMIFFKAVSSITGPNESIIIPKHLEKVDYEAELVVVIGKKGKNIPEDHAHNYIFGYTIGNDVSSRDIQFGFPNHTLHSWAKSFDTFSPIGPWIVTADEIQDPNNLNVSLKLNGETMQDSNTSQMIFKINYLVSYISKGITLYPGDLIYTGTPAGVGGAKKPPRFLRKGDKIEINIEKIGTLVNTVEREGEIIEYW